MLIAALVVAFAATANHIVPERLIRDRRCSLNSPPPVLAAERLHASYFFVYYFRKHHFLLSSSSRRRFYPGRSSGRAVGTGVVPFPPLPVRAFIFLSRIGFVAQKVHYSHWCRPSSNGATSRSGAFRYEYAIKSPYKYALGEIRTHEIFLDRHAYGTPKYPLVVLVLLYYIPPTGTSCIRVHVDTVCHPYHREGSIFPAMLGLSAPLRSLESTPSEGVLVGCVRPRRAVDGVAVGSARLNRCPSFRKQVSSFGRSAHEKLIADVPYWYVLLL